MKLRRILHAMLSIPFVLISLVCATLLSALYSVALVFIYLTWDTLPAEVLVEPAKGALALLAGGYGVLRVLAFHPAFDTAYLGWLSNTPWTPDRPLPKGPIQLVVADGIFIGGMTAAALLLNWVWPSPELLIPLLSPVLFTAGLGICWTVANAHTGQLSSVYLAMAMPLLLSLFFGPLEALGFSVFFIVPIAWFGVRRWLAEFPWDTRQQFDRFYTTNRGRLSLPYGWPYEMLLRRLREIVVSPGRAFVEALLAGGWLWMFLSLGQGDHYEQNLESRLLVTLFLGLFLTVVRLWIYMPVICSHLCWGHRLANRRWIVPQHDRIFAAPLLMLLLACGGPTLLSESMPISPPMASAVSLGGMVFLARAMGPRVEPLQYTGVHSKFGLLTNRSDFTTVEGPPAVGYSEGREP